MAAVAAARAGATVALTLVEPDRHVGGMGMPSATVNSHPFQDCQGSCHTHKIDVEALRTTPCSGTVLTRWLPPAAAVHTFGNLCEYDLGPTRPDRPPAEQDTILRAALKRAAIRLPVVEPGDLRPGIVRFEAAQLAQSDLRR